MVALEKEPPAAGVKPPRSKWSLRSWAAALGTVGAIFVVPAVWSSASSSSGGSVRITPADVQPWPFTVSAVVLRCHDKALTVTAAGTEYALNGTALAAGYPSADPIVLPDPNGVGLKMSRRQAIALGAQRCP